MKVLMVYYSMYGHILRMFEAAAEGARSVGGVDVDLRRVPEILTPRVPEAMGAADAQKQQRHIPVCTVEELGKADAIVSGTPTRFATCAARYANFWTRRDRCGPAVPWRVKWAA